MNKKCKKWSKDRVIEELKRVSKKLGHSPTYREVGHKLRGACVRYFETLNKAKKKAGLELWGLDNRPCTKLSKDITKEDFNLGYVVGVALGDGHIDAHSLSLEVKDKNFADLFLQILEEWSGREPKIHSRYNKKYNSTYYRIRLFSVKIKKFLDEFTKDFDNILNSNLEFKRGFFKGVFDSEGCISPSNNVFFIANSDRNLINILRKIGESFGLRNPSVYAKTYGNGYKTVYNLTYIGKSNLLRLCDEIGVTIKRKIRPLEDEIKRWREEKRIYERVIELGREHSNKAGVARLVSEEFNKRIPDRTVAHWINQNRTPMVVK